MNLFSGCRCLPLMASLEAARLCEGQADRIRPLICPLWTEVTQDFIFTWQMLQEPFRWTCLFKIEYVFIIPLSPK